MNAKTMAQGVAAGRVAFGALCLAIPRTILGPTAKTADGPMVWMIRAFCIRDVVLGAGAIRAINEGDGKDWVRMGAMADTADAVTAVVCKRELGGKNLTATLSLAIPAAAAGWYSSAEDWD